MSIIQSFLKNRLKPVPPIEEKKVAGHTEDNKKPADSPNCREIYLLAEFSRALGFPSGIYAALYNRNRRIVSTPHIYNNVNPISRVTHNVSVPSMPTGRSHALPPVLLPAPRVTPTRPFQNVSECDTVKSLAVERSSPYWTPDWINSAPNSTPSRVPALPAGPAHSQKFPADPLHQIFELREHPEEPLLLLYGACRAFLRKWNKLPNALHVSSTILPGVQHDTCLEIRAPWDGYYRLSYAGKSYLIQVKTGSNLPALLQLGMGEELPPHQAIAVYYA